MSWLLAAAVATAQQAEPVRPVISDAVISDIIAGYRAWELRCAGGALVDAPASCEAEASDQITTIRLRRTPNGLEISLASRLCPDGVGEARASLSAADVQPRRRRRDAERPGRLHSRFAHLEDGLLRSCARQMIEPSRVYDLLLLKRFLEQSDVVLAGGLR